jgi:hypothetical protein
LTEDTVGRGVNLMGRGSTVWLLGCGASLEAVITRFTVMPALKFELMVTSKMQSMEVAPGGDGHEAVTGARCVPSVALGSV